MKLPCTLTRGASAVHIVAEVVFPDDGNWLSSTADSVESRCTLKSSSWYRLLNPAAAMVWPPTPWFWPVQSS